MNFISSSLDVKKEGNWGNALYEQGLWNVGKWIKFVEIAEENWSAQSWRGMLYAIPY